MHTFDSLCRYPKRKNVSLSNPLTRIRRTRLSQGVGPRNPLAKNRILRSVNRIARLRGRVGRGKPLAPSARLRSLFQAVEILILHRRSVGRVPVWLPPLPLSPQAGERARRACGDRQAPRSKSLLLHLARRRLRRTPAAAAREGVEAALRPGAVDGALREHIPGGVPVAERIAVPRRARRETRQAELFPDAARAFHVFARRQRE